MSKYKVGDFVTFYDELDQPYDEWFDNQIDKVTKNGKYIFTDFSGEWSEDIILGYSPDYKRGPDGIHDIRLDNG